MNIPLINILLIKPNSKVPKRNQDTGSLSGPKNDVFQHTIKKFPDFSCDTKEFTKAEMEDYSHLAEKRHIDRMKKYDQNQEDIPPREVSEKEFKAINNVQYEEDEYSSIQDKLKKHIPLSSKEEIFLSFIISQMKPAEDNRVLWRAIGIYDGFEEQIKNGILKFDCLTSTNSRYDDFFDFWRPSSFEKRGDTTVIKEGYILKINVPKGTKLLDCNAVYKNKGTRMRSEVVLPPSIWHVDSIDKDLNVIELYPLKSE